MRVVAQGTGQAPATAARGVPVGPLAGSGRIAGHNATPAFRAIAGARAPLVSRADASGTDAFERRVWREAGSDPPHEGARGIAISMAAWGPP